MKQLHALRRSVQSGLVAIQPARLRRSWLCLDAQVALDCLGKPWPPPPPPPHPPPPHIHTRTYPPLRPPLLAGGAQGGAQPACALCACPQLKCRLGGGRMGVGRLGAGRTMLSGARSTHRPGAARPGSGCPGCCSAEVEHSCPATHCQGGCEGAASLPPDRLFLFWTAFSPSQEAPMGFHPTCRAVAMLAQSRLAPLVPLVPFIPMIVVISWATCLQLGM